MAATVNYSSADEVKIIKYDMPPHVESGNFRFVPKPFASLAGHVLSCSWDVVKSRLRLYISETPTLDVIRWITYLQTQQVEKGKSPFVDVAKNHGKLHMFDGEGKEVGTVTFSHLKVIRHQAHFDRQETHPGFYGVDSEPASLCHLVVLEYDDCELLLEEDRKTAIDPGPTTQFEDESEDWSDVELAVATHDDEAIARIQAESEGG